MASRFFDDANEPKEHPFTWTTPVGWTEGTVSKMRLIDFRFGPNGEGECYLTALPQDGGGAAANLNRWRGQLGQSPLGQSEIDALPKKTLLGAEGIFLTVDGDFKGMGDAADAKKDYRLLGVLLPNDQLTIFVKLTGPKALVEANAAGFESFCASLKFRGKSEAIPSH
jgi:hypothetical protein